MSNLDHFAQSICALPAGTYGLNALAEACGYQRFPDRLLSEIERRMRDFCEPGVEIEGRCFSSAGAGFGTRYTITMVAEQVPLVSLDDVAGDDRFAIMEVHTLPLDARKVEFLRVDGYWFIKASDDACDTFEELWRAKLAAEASKVAEVS